MKMSASVVLTSVGRDELAKLIGGKESDGFISYVKIGEGGFSLSPEITENIAVATGSLRDYTYTISGGELTIVSADDSANEFEIAGDYTEFFQEGVIFRVSGSTGNDGVYDVGVGGSTYGSSVTTIPVTSVPDGTDDGVIEIDKFPIARGGGSHGDGIHWKTIVEEVTSGLSVVQTLSDDNAIGTFSGDGTGTINYKNGEISVEFASVVSAGNTVRVRYKYHNNRLDPSSGTSLTELIAESSDVDGIDGNTELFFYKKDFGASDVIVRGVGYGTVRFSINVEVGEGSDDGRAETYGGAPYYFEFGLYSASDVLIAYGTLDKAKKNVSSIINHTVDLVV